MREKAAAGVILVRHVWRVWRAGQLRFRAETYGLYWPALPHKSPWWRVSPRHVLTFARQAPSYCRWVIEMERVRSGGGVAWWSDVRRQSRHRGRS